MHSWPARKRSALRAAALERLAGSFETSRNYDEQQVNTILRSVMDFEDHVLIRRELVDAKLLGRSPDGRRYWREASAE